ncbi:MAG: hypothetical protein KBI35_10670 [Ruminococcus sp.]|nr:hypothetical protein [Ruminococcus sp.]MBP8594864.1 hypothetical protein [Ruminococcus sp.]MBQ3856849.1 hypothetical protein [Ruminococcus sp.]HBB20472.1 hypothetical protein [Ruminococcus sp.]HOO07272.1 hypothetical protein [Ruminococcus sp.]
MKNMINGYITSCTQVKERIAQLTEQKTKLKKQGRTDLIDQLMLERRIQLLYTEHREMKEVIEYLSGYMRRIEQRAKT